MKKALHLLLLVILLVQYTLVCAQRTLPVEFTHGQVYFPENFKSASQQVIHPDEIVNDHYVRYIQFSTLPTSEQRKTLETAGIKWISYVHFGAYLVAIPIDFDLNQLLPLSPRSIMPADAPWKLHANLKNEPYGQWAVHGDQIDVVIQVYPHISIETGAELLQKNNIQVIRKGTQNGFIQVRIPQNKLNTTAALPFVRWMELLPEPAQPDDLEGRSTIRANLVDSDHPLGRKYNGAGVNVLVRDDGITGPHIDFKGRLFNQPGTGLALVGSHGDRVTGVLGGAGNIDPTKKGIAAGSNLFVIDYTTDFQDATLPLHLTENITITNSSYSNGCNTGYTLAAQTVDQQLFEHPSLMHIFSAGNSNNSDCGYGAGPEWGNITGGNKMAKNSLMAANIQIDGAIHSTSSRGPAYDGRLKPDLASYGSDQVSTGPDNTYQIFGGTSAAAPGIAGAFAQLTHAWKTIHAGQQAPTALLKVALLNTANDLGNPGPDFIYGWGSANTYKALLLLENQQHSSGLVEHGQNTTHQITIPANTRRARIMIGWAEQPAAENAARALINDLDITITGPNNTIYHPWVLNHLPDTITLNTPAGTGRDSLNNTEQISIDNPTAGTYTVHISGHEVPFGPQAYELVWTYDAAEPRIIYPSGGESLVPGTEEWIRWDNPSTTPCILEYSTNNGTTFNAIATVESNKNSFLWTIPNTISGKVKLKISDDLHTTITEHTFSIAPVPDDLEIAQVCPDSTTIAWSPLAVDTLNYDVFLLGEKYMELKSTTSSHSYRFAHDPTGDLWASVRSSHPSGLIGRRAVAINWIGGLKNCIQPNDLAVKNITAPENNSIVSCGPVSQPITIQIANEGQNIASGASLSVQIDNLAPIIEALPNIAPGSNINHTLSAPVLFNQNGNVAIKATVVFNTDSYLGNNSQTKTYYIITTPQEQLFSATFDEQPPLLPLGWSIQNPDNSVAWKITQQPITGPQGSPTFALQLNHFNYPGSGQEDYVYLPPMKLNTIEHPILRFQYAHAQYNATFQEKLKVEAFLNCDLSTPPIVLWEKTDPNLATTLTTSLFTPNTASVWQAASVSLSELQGNELLIRFTSVNDYGNNTYLDNIGIEDRGPELPGAYFEVPDTLCWNSPVVFQAPGSNWPFNTYQWKFGAGAQPATAFGAGPHAITYTQPGSPEVQLIGSNAYLIDTFSQVIFLQQPPVSAFTQLQENLQVSFTNLSQGANSFLWNFGDSQTEISTNPVHNYGAPGTYLVELNATNVCNTVSSTKTLVLTSGTIEQTGLSAIQILPNPNSGSFQVQIDNAKNNCNATISLLDTNSRLLIEQQQQRAIPTGRTLIDFHQQSLPAGVYPLVIQTEQGGVTLNIVVIK